MNLDKAILIATKAHQNQVDKAGKPYILHPIRVMMKMENETEQIVAVFYTMYWKTALIMMKNHLDKMVFPLKS